MPKQLDITRFNTWADFVSACENADVTKTVEDNRQSRKGGLDFAGSKSFEEAIHTCKSFVWPKAQKKAREISNTLINRVSSLIPQSEIYYDVEGQTLDVGAYLSGEPECWQRSEDVLVDGPGLTVHRFVFNIAVSSFITTDTMIHRGILAASVVNLLEQCGHRCELTLCLGSTSKSTRSYHNQKDAWHDEVYVTIKDANQPLDLDRLIVAFAYPSVLRRLSFALMEAYPDKAKRDAFGVGYSYGYPLTGSDKGDIHIDSVTWAEGDATANDLDAATDWIIKQLKAQGITIEGSN